MARFTSSACDNDPTTTITDVALAQLLRLPRFLRLDGLHWDANQTVQRARASRHAEWRCGCSRWLAPSLTFNVRQHYPHREIKMTPPTTNLHFQGLRTVLYHAPDLDKAKAWYSEVLGIAPYFDQPFYVGFSVCGYELGLDPDASTTPGGSGGVAV